MWRIEMGYKRKSWREKLADSKGLPRVEPIPEGMNARWGAGTLVIPAPMEVDEIMGRVPQGRLITVNEIRSALARKHGTTIGCPITTGIFAMIAAHVAREELEEGRIRVTPYWRTLKSGGEINPKYPGGIEEQKARLESEGHRVVRKGKKYLVENYEKHLIQG
jgi:alkylated DNA nucleotide flippase Atl1